MQHTKQHTKKAYYFFVGIFNEAINKKNKSIQSLLRIVYHLINAIYIKLFELNSTKIITFLHIFYDKVLILNIKFSTLKIFKILL